MEDDSSQAMEMVKSFGICMFKYTVCTIFKYCFTLNILGRNVLELKVNFQMIKC